MKNDVAKMMLAEMMLNEIARSMALAVKVAEYYGDMTFEEAEAYLMDGFEVHGSIFRDMTPEEIAEKVKELCNEN